MSSRHLHAPYTLRMPDDLRQHLEQAARENGRSLNAEILLRLQSTIDQFEGGQLSDPDALADRLANLECQVQAMRAELDELRRR